jgi:hypothetical protein
MGGQIEFATCFNAVATAAQALGADLPTEITVLSGEPSVPQPTPTTGSIGSTTVTVETLRLQAYRVHFGYRGGGFLEIPVYIGADAVWGLGATPSDGRRYSITGDLAAWTDPVAFVLEAFTYQVDGRCSGSGGRKAVGTMVLERVAQNGSITEAYRGTCGPAELGAAFGDWVDLTQGGYRVRFEGVLVGMSGQIGAIGAWR